MDIEYVGYNGLRTRDLTGYCFNLFHFSKHALIPTSKKGPFIRMGSLKLKPTKKLQAIVFTGLLSIYIFIAMFAAI